MSKKTRKQKILAELHRKNNFSYQFPLAAQTSHAQNKFSALTPPESETKNPITPSPIDTTSHYQNTSIYSYPIQSIKKDLTKTILLCILAISFEIALYLVLEKHLILPFKIK